jgi:predicted RNA-binding protein with PUA-like domain
MAYWLFKTEPDEFSINTLQAKGASCWEGVRNYQARNMIRDQIQVGDRVFIYHSSCKNIGIAGVAKVIKGAYPDHFQFDPTSDYYDPKSDSQQPRWFMVDIEFELKFDRILPLSALKTMPELSELALVKRGNRLSVMPVSDSEWQAIMRRVNTK